MIRKPRGLGAAGKNLWDRVTETYQIEDYPEKLECLNQACRVADQIADLDKAAKGQPLTVRGSQGQQVISPLISEARFQRGTLAGLLSKLNFTDEE